MTQLEMSLLRYFVENEGAGHSPPRAVGERLADAGQINTRAPDQFIRRLRKIFEPDPAEPAAFSHHPRRRLPVSWPRERNDHATGPPVNSCESETHRLRNLVSRSCARPWPAARTCVDVEFLPKGLHDIGQAGMSARLKEALAAVDESKYDAVLLGYGLCSNGWWGWRPARIPLVVPRAHDCITLFLGSKERYLDYFQKQPGRVLQDQRLDRTRRGPGPVRRRVDPSAGGHDANLRGVGGEVRRGQRPFPLRAVVQHDAELRKLTFIEMGIEPDDRFERDTREQAAAARLDSSRSSPAT